MNLPKLNPNTPTLMDSEVRLFKRKRSSVWQVVFTTDGRQVRVSSKKRNLKDALEAARDIYLDYRFRQKKGLPVISKRFASVAALCRATMAEQLETVSARRAFVITSSLLISIWFPSMVTSSSPVLITRCCKSLPSGEKRRWGESQEPLH